MHKVVDKRVSKNRRVEYQVDWGPRYTQGRYTWEPHKGESEEREGQDWRLPAVARGRGSGQREAQAQEEEVITLTCRYIYSTPTCNI